MHSSDYDGLLLTAPFDDPTLLPRKASIYLSCIASWEASSGPSTQLVSVMDRVCKCRTRGDSEDVWGRTRQSLLAKLCRKQGS